MIKIVYCLRRKAGMSAEDFHEYWLNTHGPLVRRHAKTLAILRYVQTHTTQGGLPDAMIATRGSMIPYDGIAEIWCDSEDAVFAAARTPEGRAAGKVVAEDERNFIDTESSNIFVGTEHVIEE